MYLLILSFIIPITGIFLPIIMGNDYGWILTILIVVLGLLFSWTSFRERKDKWAIGALLLNIAAVIYAAIVTTQFFMS
ncbi:hypothetical protein [Nosocomiicoccus ampullae]|uniref:Uncharacterized protein n=1 Tax=Nosocomiicoccus ampullae TaxID=489910 RepID=A0A9Q2D101_9STAP|nr:hypothetical protein [Nosocomiicoccus ampullae]MBB5176475.1 hypothetical protein [Nosocomiicoccus ampullae]QYA46517.1 hypothetical protein KPF49_06005 [Nosocomiicoccus ampullae]QYA48088.1 hypothetical protein KPF52_06640 [Nosocomiicoccus ampullae]